MPVSTRRKPRRSSAAARSINARTALKPHQRNITTYLSQYCPSQTGVILYHYMGTGKSFCSTSIAINWGKPIVLLAPQMLLGQWKNDYIDRYAATRPPVTKMVSYETVWALLDKHDVATPEGRAWYAKHTLMMDECHNIADWMNRRVDVNKRGKYMKSLMAFGHRVLLTGTPMYWGPRDLAFQVNIAAGKPVMPVDAAAFEREYFLTNYYKSALFGWFEPIHNFNQALIGTMQGLIARTTQFSMQIGLGSVYFALAHDNTSQMKKVFNTMMHTLRHFQAAQSAMLQSGESAYFAAFNVPISALTKIGTKPFQAEYRKLARAVKKHQDTEIDEKLNLNALDAFWKYRLISDADYFVFINKFIEDSKTDKKRASQFGKPKPPKPGPNATDIELTDYHRDCLLAIYYKDKRTMREYKRLTDVLSTEASKKVKSKETAKAFLALRKKVYADGGKEHVDFYVRAFMWNVKRQVQVLIWELQYVVMIACISLVLWTSARMYTEKSELRYINTAYFEKKVAPHISYYKPDGVGDRSQAQREQGWLQWLRRPLSRKQGRAASAAASRRSSAAEDRTFPTVIEKEARAPYTAHQTDIFIKYTMGKMDYHDYAALQLIESPTDNPELASFDQTLQANFELYGCYIGSICKFKADARAKLHPHARQHLTFDKKSNVWTLAKGSTFAEVAPKFDAVVANIQRHGGRHCVYSNYAFAAKSMCAHLVATFGAENVRFVANDATSEDHKAILEGWYYRGGALKDAPPKVLLLDTRYTEGLSVLMTDAMHILDPCQSLAKEEQLKARVARLNSHRKGDTLHLYEYMAYCPMFKKAMTSVMKWMQLSREHLYFSMPTNYSQNLTPEYLVKRRLQNMDKLTQKLTTKLQTTSVERYMPDLATVAKEGAKAKWTKKMPAWCGEQVACAVSTPGNQREWDAAGACHFGAA